MFVRLESPSGATSLCQRLPVSNHYIRAPEGDFSLTNIVSQSHN